ncbi:unnamed protein product [Adineta steineri]|uniref:F-box domain-containing protein n=1 Tax=Adineta steineri TaxID=433720 RepID=A0A814T6N6_9BILA|nr:unnamed protein product [Adineta steineri]CAF3846018.1 unnamed protein product [Adineta steineri]
MEYSCVDFNDLPDEILMIIFKKLNNFEVLYSLQGVNQRLNTIVQDSVFTNRLTFVKMCSGNFIDVFCCNTVLDRFCLQILPVIHDKIKWLDLESSSMKNVLCVADYPNLYGLGLYNINEESFRCLFTDETLTSATFKNQITTLAITIDNNNHECYEDMLLSAANIVNYILTVFTNLIYLTLYESSYKNRVPLISNNGFPLTFRSSTLLKLNIRVQCFDDCLYLLDGRFNQLHTFCVDLVNLRHPQEIKNHGDLPNLKCCVLSCKEISSYDELILPLLYRMSNLEQLGLYITISIDTRYNDGFIDGNHLKRNIINRLLRLNDFKFHICSWMFIHNQSHFSSTKDIQRTFIDFPINNIISYVDYFPEAKRSQCQIYSYPSLTPHYEDITNSFPGGFFKYVRVVSLFDEHPFEHEFFLQIQKSFPLMEELSVFNCKSQNKKQSYESDNDNQNLPLIEYSLLNELAINTVHDDYIEQFLLNTKTYLQNNVFLYIEYESLQRVTHNFTREDTRINCMQINKLKLCGERICRNSFLQAYFPFAKISYPGQFFFE